MRLRQYAVPLQAFFALFICVGMAWMVFVMAGFNPTPPSPLDLQLRSTQDVSFASMNSTAAALAFEMVSDYIPSPIVLQVPITGSTNTPTGTITAAVGAFYTAPPSLTPTSIFAFLFTLTPTRDPRQPTPTWTLTLKPTLTKTLVPTATKPKTATATATELPTTTPVPPTRTATLEPPPTDEPTATPVPTMPEPTTYP